ncbi:MAG: haloacid dehalogenase-like hydrolase [Sterolibacteriaceae bacterium MAG5]|nr:haloacid dehalogenase-like hydrolase [Candidatus Nitricoxidireducens bremensis]
MRPLAAYATLVFDCDGVILDSNRVKTAAFRQVALPHGEAAAEALVAYHIRHGGVSRYRKFEHFIGGILGRAPDAVLLQELLDRFAAEVRRGLLECEIAAGLAALRATTPASRWLVVSGGDQEELRWLFSHRGIAELFNGGIFGSPDTKSRILGREISAGNVAMPALFLGDSRLDYEAAAGAGLDFLFVSGWTEFDEWKSLQKVESFPSVAGLKSLISGGEFGQ